MNAVSDEQQHIINMVQQGKNVQVDACAGSGKSTTILSTAKSMPDKTFLLITYNKSLRKEMKEKVDELGLQNVTVHTYHSLAVAVYDKDAHKDKEMRLIISKNAPPNNSMFSKKKHDIIVLDEVQDMKFLFYRFVIKYVIDVGEKIHMMILGDYMQGLYEYQGSDARFLTMANEIWKKYDYLRTSEFEMCQLKTSYRITNQMADFVNEVMLDEKRLYACREGDPVCYVRRKIHELQKVVVHEILNLMTNHDVKPSDIFVLAGSVKSTNNYITQIENALVEAGIPCHVPMLENSDNIDDDVIKGKVVFSTFHTSKGRQREYVFVLGFNTDYQTKFSSDPTKCPNTLYVATTRAQKRLYLLEISNGSNKPLEFLKQTHVQMNSKPYVDFRGIPQTKFEDDTKGLLKEKEFVRKTTPTEMTRHISDSVLDEITESLDEIFMPVMTNQKEIELPTTLMTKKGFCEDVSDLNGIAIPNIFYDYMRELFENQSETCVLYEMIQEGIANIHPEKHSYLKEIVKKLNPTCESVEDYLYMANVYQAVQEKLYFRLKQIERDEYNWLTEDVLEKCKQRLIDVLENEMGELEQPQMERSIIDYSDEEAQKKIAECLSPYFPTNKQFQFSARIDLMTETTLWELKCTSEISTEHMIQTVIYAWIMRTIDPAFSKQVKIFNVRTGEVLELVAEKETLDKIVVSLLKGKYEELKVLSDEEFLKECHGCLETCSQKVE